MRAGRSIRVLILLAIGVAPLWTAAWTSDSRHRVLGPRGPGRRPAPPAAEKPAAEKPAADKPAAEKPDSRKARRR